MGLKIFAEGHGKYSRKAIAQTLGFSRELFYYENRLPEKDKEIANKIEHEYETDDTLGSRALAKLLHAVKNRVKRIMIKYGIKARMRKGMKWSRGKASTVFPNHAREAWDRDDVEMVFSDIFEIQLKDRSKIRGCFALRKKTRQILALVFDYHMRAELVLRTIEQIRYVDFGMKALWHSDQGKQYGAKIVAMEILRRGFIGSMSRAGTPTDNAYAERFVGSFKRAVAYRRKYATLGDFLEMAEKWVNFYNDRRPHQGLGMLSPNQFALKNNLHSMPYLSLFSC